jgi:hypothetical protein
MSVRRLAFFFTSPCKGEVGAQRRVRVRAARRLTPSLTLPLSGGGNTSAPLIKSQLPGQLSYAHG